jgi:hypothetical protein
MTIASHKKRHVDEVKEQPAPTLDVVSPKKPRVETCNEDADDSMEADAAKKGRTVEEFLGDKYLRSTKEVQQVTVKGWLWNRRVWYQYYRPNKKHPNRVCMDMDELCQTKAARTFRQLLKQNLPMAIAVIGDEIPVKDKQGRIIKDEQGRVKMSPTYSFAKLTLQDLVLASYQLDATEMRFCSMSWSDLPVHGYVDIDCKVDEHGFALLHGRMHEMLEELLLRMDEYHLLILQRKVNRDHMQIGPACTDNKVSVHIQWPAEVYANLTHLLAWRDGLVHHIVTKHLNSLLGQVLSKLDKLIDASVYNSFSNLKMLGCGKPGRQPIRLYDMATRQYTALTEMSLEQRMEALFYEQPSFALCAPKEQGMNRWPSVDERVAQIKHRIERGEQITVEGLRESYFGLSLADMQAAAEENDIELVGERHASDTCVSFQTRNINAPRTCTVSGAEVEHRSWYAGCYVTKGGRLMLTCPASGCKGHRKQILAVHTMGAKEAVLWDIVDAIDKEQVKNWDATVKAMVQAGANKEQLVDLTEDTPAADVVEHSYALYSKLDDKELPRKPGPLLTILKAQEVDKMELDVYRLRLKAAERAVAAPAPGAGNAGSVAEIFAAAFTRFHGAPMLPLRQVMEWWNVHSSAALADPSFLNNSLMPFLNRFWKHVTGAGQVYVKTPQGAGFYWEGVHVPKFKLENYAHFILEGLPARKKKHCGEVATIWFGHADKAVYASATLCSPYARESERAGPHEFDLWTDLLLPHAEALAQGNPLSDGAVTFKKFFMEGLCEQETPAVREWNWKWYCSQYQRPGYRLKRGMLMYSGERQVGKTFAAELLVYRLLGVHLGILLDQDDALGDFNSLVLNKVFVCFEEYEHSIKQMRKLRDFITNSMVASRLKGIDTKLIRANRNAMATANSDVAFPPKEWQNRGVISEIGLGIRGESWKHLKDKDWNMHDIAAMMLAEDLSKWNPEVLPDSVGGATQGIAVEEQSAPVAAWFRAVLNGEADGIIFDCQLPIQLAWTSFSQYHGGGDHGIAKFVKGVGRDQLSKRWKAEALPCLVTMREQKSAFCAGVTAMMGNQWQASGKESCVSLPPENECRRIFEQHTKTVVEKPK